jgi:hypothetical protein
MPVVPVGRIPLVHLCNRKGEENSEAGRLHGEIGMNKCDAFVSDISTPQILLRLRCVKTCAGEKAARFLAAYEGHSHTHWPLHSLGTAA